VISCHAYLPARPFIYTLCIYIFVQWQLTHRPASSSAKKSPSTHWGKIRHKFQRPNFDQTRLQSYWLTKTCYECLGSQTLSLATRRRVWSTSTFHFKKNCVLEMCLPGGKSIDHEKQLATGPRDTCNYWKMIWSMEKLIGIGVQYLHHSRLSKMQQSLWFPCLTWFPSWILLMTI
jgi:hypothetical protein